MGSIQIFKLFRKLLKQNKQAFPPRRKKLEASSKHGVYIIRKNRTILHVGRTLRGEKGLEQRLKNHLGGASSFVKNYLKGRGSKLRRKGYTYQFLEVSKDKERAYLEALATGILCPKHIGTGRLR